MAFFSVRVVLWLILLDIYPYTADAESCTNFTTHTTLTGETVTLKFSLPDTCNNDLRLVTVAAETDPGNQAAKDICMIMGSSWLKESVPECSLDHKSGVYSVTRWLGGTPSRRERIILTAVMKNGRRIITNVLLQLPDTSTLPSVSATHVTNNDKTSTDQTAERRESSDNTGAGDEETATEKDESIPVEDSASQTPAFAIMGVVIAVMVVLVAVLLFRQKRILQSFARRSSIPSSSYINPDNYEIQMASNNSNRPTPRPRGRQQQTLPPPPPPASTLAGVKRDSVPDPNYEAIGEARSQCVSGNQYEIPVPMEKAPSMPDAEGGSAKPEAYVMLL